MPCLGVSCLLRPLMDLINGVVLPLSQQSLLMFKKAVKISAQSQMSGKDRKNFRNKLVTLFDPASIEAIIKKNDKIVCSKVAGSKMLIYMNDEYPLFVDGTGKEDFFPSIYACAAYQSLSKSVTINEGVESYIFNGANLMWPGVTDISALGCFKKDEVISIKDSEGHLIGVGALSCSMEELKKNNDGSGVAVFILHYKGDRLWDMGDKQYPEVVLKGKEEEWEEEEEELEEEEVEKAEKVKEKEETTTGETKKQGIKKANSQSESDSGSDEEDNFEAMVHTKQTSKPQVKVEQKAVDNFSDEEDTKNHKKGKKKAGKKAAKKKEESDEEEPPKQSQKYSEEMEEEETKKPKGKRGKGKKHNQQDSDEEKQEEPKKKQPKKKKEDQDEELEKEEKSAISSHLMDQYFKEAFLNVIKLSKLELPIDSGRFFSDHMVLARTDETPLSIKDSSFKKLGKFYEQMAKLKFIEFKPAKEKKGQQGSTITKILWESEELKNYVPTIRRMGEKEAEGKEEVVSKQKLVLSKTLTVDFAYKLNKDLENILIPKKVINYMPDHSEEEEEVETKKEIYFLEGEVKEKIEKYITSIAMKEDKKDEIKKEEIKEGKGKGGKERKVERMVTLSYKENALIHRLLKNEIEAFEENVTKKEMMEPSNSDEEEESKKKGKKDKNRQNLFKIERNFIVNKLMKLAHPFYLLTDKETGLNKFREGTFKGIELITDKVMNKNVTKIIGLQTFIPATFKEDEVVRQIHGFSHFLQVKFASSSTVQNLPGKNAGKEVVVQGNFVDELESMFTMEYGLKKDCITIQNKLGKKKKQH